MKKFASDIIKKSVVTTEGEIVGTVNNLVIDTDTGEIRTVLISPKGDLDVTIFPKDPEGRYMVPLTSIKSFKDVFVIDLTSKRKSIDQL